MNKLTKAALFVLLPLALAVLGGALWGLVDWLRNYGSGISPFPYFDHLYSNLDIDNRYDPATMFGQTEHYINLYNLNFRGGTRFGSGLGFMAGAFVAMGLYKEQSLFCRTTAGILAGAEIGSRFALNLGSGVPLFFTGAVTGAVVGAAYMSFAAGPPKAQKLPDKELAQIS